MPESLTFSAFNLHPSLLSALPAQFQVPTPVQQQTLPSIMGGQDVLALAPTGSGKTLAFGLGLLQQLTVQPPAMGNESTLTTAPYSRAHMRAVVIVPTRELAAQISEVLTPLAQSVSLTLTTLCGGVDLELQVADFNRQPAQIVIATPGRLLDLLRQKLISLKAVQHLVLDEADRLLEMGFWPDIQKLMAAMPALQQQLLFSATLPAELAEQLTQLVPNAHRFAVGSQNSVVEGVSQTCYLVNKGSKAQALIALLKGQLTRQQVLVFINARDSADAVAKKLNKAGIQALALHGEKDQAEREQALLAFKHGDINVLVATDLLARGIDVTALPVVVNLDLPPSAPVYVHRVGRTARAGLTGAAVSLVCHGEASALAAIRELTGEALPLLPLAGFPVTDQPASEARSKRPPRDKQANRRNANKRRNKSVRD
ncbi:DEAD/DEAH box helicase [Oceanisphaera arctica]|uniref:DEAD/DEAH box helicase n=2 Tax=Oceanisphaera arctica TaxID=641510 RepID=A0A2P5TQD5_9GAMM|nr:DEAD/DEAH box helicase [Oceanisphaera arctica]PPL17990.1 DEAD/DEAH box helicase [Oceanisphaera arctica]